MSLYDDSILTARPPYIRFERRAVEKRKTLEEGGASYYVDVDFALVTPHGSKDILEKIVDEWLPRLAEECRQGRFNTAWLTAYKEAYHAWKNDQEPPLNGTSIKMWPVASPAEVQQLLAMRCLTVEDLAAANEEMLGRIGMGARSLKQRAIDWLTGKSGQGPLIAQLDALRQMVTGLEARLEESAQQTKMLETQLAARQEFSAPSAQMQSVEDRLHSAKGQDTTDRDIDATINELLE
jgi:hypothetical protein